MPLVTEIQRNNKVHKPEGGWTTFVVNCMYTAALKESDPEMKFESGRTVGDMEDNEVIDFFWTNHIYMLDREKFNAPLIRHGEQTFLQEHVFDNGEQCITFLPGDRVKAWRE